MDNFVSFSSNSFLWNSLWGELGLRLAGDLLKLTTIPDILDYAEVSEGHWARCLLYDGCWPETPEAQAIKTEAA